MCDGVRFGVPEPSWEMRRLTELADALDLRTSPTAAIVRETRLVVVLRRVAPRERLLALVAELADAGVRAFEITFDDPSAADDLVACRERLAALDDVARVVGAGTVVDLGQLESAIGAGADFGVSPILELEVLEAAGRAGLPFVPGAYTPTEAHLAWRSGATFVKLFPASSLGPAHVREMRGPLPEVETIPTGGIDGTNARSFLDAGAVAVGIGSAIVRATAAERRAMVAAVGRSG